MISSVILFVEKESGKVPTFADAIERKGYSVATADTGTRALTQATERRPAVIVLNAASLGSSGVRICKRLTDKLDVPLIHILPEGTSKVTHADGECAIRLILPFTPRKLHNRIKQLVPANRTEGLQKGPIKLSTKVGVVEAYDRETRLTPKAANLLALFMQHPGETLSRGFLMRTVWNTDYIGDTRTLDVHVRWVREAIEDDPHQPKHIRTVRGVGYCFDADPTN